jgi:TonB family protein
MFTELRVDERRGAPRFVIENTVREAMRCCTGGSGYVTGAIERGDPTVVRVAGMIDARDEPKGEPVIGIYRVFGGASARTPESECAKWNRAGEPHVRMLLQRTASRTVGTFWFDSGKPVTPARDAVPFWRRHQLAFVSATALPIVCAIVLATAPDVHTQSPQVIEFGRHTPVALSKGVPGPIATAHADFKPAPGQAVLIPVPKQGRESVRVRVRVDETGHVLQADLLGPETTPPHVAEAVLKAVKNTAYQPALKKGDQEFEVSFLIESNRGR